MRFKKRSVSVIGTFCCLFLLTAQSFATTKVFPDDYYYDEPINMGSNINSPYADYHDTHTADGNTMVFASNRPGGYGGSDLYISHRVNGEWQPAENLGPNVNSEMEEYFPAITPDGNQLFFTWEDYVTKTYVTEKINGEWQPAVLLPPTVNQSWANNNSKFVSHDGRWLYFDIWGGSRWYWDIWRVDLTSDNFSVVEKLPEGTINDGNRQFTVYLTDDSKYFVYRGGWYGDHFYISEIVDGVFQPRQEMPPRFQQDFKLAENETMMYTNLSNLADGYGGTDIYYAPAACLGGGLDLFGFMGEDKVMSPVPLAGQHTNFTVTVEGNGGSQVYWQFLVDGEVHLRGSGLNFNWDVWQSFDEIVSGTHELTLFATTADDWSYDGCIGEQTILVNFDWNDDCKVDVTFSPLVE